MHELIHAVDEYQNKHGPVLKKMALNLGLQGPILKAFIHYGPPICPKDRVEMVAIQTILVKYKNTHLSSKLLYPTIKIFMG